MTVMSMVIDSMVDGCVHVYGSVYMCVHVCVGVAEQLLKCLYIGEHLFLTVNDFQFQVMNPNQVAYLPISSMALKCFCAQYVTEKETLSLSVHMTKLITKFYIASLPPVMMLPYIH